MFIDLKKEREREIERENFRNMWNWPWDFHITNLQHYFPIHHTSVTNNASHTIAKTTENPLKPVLQEVKTHLKKQHPCIFCLFSRDPIFVEILVSSIKYVPEPPHMNNKMLLEISHNHCICEQKEKLLNSNTVG